MKIILSPAAREVITVLENNGYEAFAVGGCVRDAILHRVPGDWDVTTSALPEKTLELFSHIPEFHAVPTGIKHGTVTVVYQKEPVEVTTYRIDGVYGDHRRPDSVKFTGNLRDDLARRDFTVNAMAYSDERGLIDLYGGTDDIRAGIIRCVGEPEKRFGEDALRILRALRFASVLGFTVEKDTAGAALRLGASLCHVSRERIFAELSKLLCGGSAAAIIGEFLPVISQILPSSSLRDAEKICESLKRLDIKELPLLYAALLAHTDPAAAGVTMRSLRADTGTVRRTETIVENLGFRIENETDVKRLCRDIGTDNALDVIRLGIARSERNECELSMIENIQRRGECVSLAGLAVGGRDLLCLGACPRDIGGILEMLLDGVISGKTENNSAVLLEVAKRIIDRKEKA